MLRGDFKTAGRQTHNYYFFNYMVINQLKRQSKVLNQDLSPCSHFHQSWQFMTCMSEQHRVMMFKNCFVSISTCRQYTTEKGRRSVQKLWSLFTANTPLRKDAGVFKSFGRYLPPVHHWERTQECSKALVVIYRQYTTEKGRRSVQKLWSLFTANTPLRKDAGVFKSFGRYLPSVHHWERTQECSKALVVIYRQ